MIPRIVITEPLFSDGEAKAIERMLTTGALRVHIRKPHSTAAEIAALVGDIDPSLRPRLSLHDHTGLAAELGVGGVHLNSRCPSVPAGFKGLVSRSCHSIDELAANRDGADYLFLSPIADSISKPGYSAAFTTEKLTEAASQGIIDGKVYALGGMSPATWGYARAIGFGGVALLGAAWQPVDRRRFALQYITNGATAEETAASTLAALQGGCRWVQLRMKDASEASVLEAAALIAPMCRAYGATFLLDDYVNLVDAAGADGVHVGKNDLPVAEVRRILGPGYIVGATANTAADIVAAAAAGADYCGLGPLRFTTTKKKLSPTLGYEGVAQAIADARTHGASLPVVAIGGVTPADVAPLLEAGAAGVAVSGAITAAADPRGATRIFTDQLTKHF